MKVDFDELKRKVSLPDLFLKLGWKPHIGSTNRAPKFTDGYNVVVVKKNQKDYYTYWDVHSPNISGKTVLDLMQDHLQKETGKKPSLREVGEILTKYLENDLLVTSITSSYKVDNVSLTRDEIYALSNQLHDYHGDFLQKRGIKKETMESHVFKNVFFTREYKKNNVKYQNTCTKMYSKEKFEGISERNFGYKGFVGAKYESLSVSQYDNSRPIDKLYVGESMIDNVSHYQLKNLNSKENIVYISSEGNLTQGQLDLISFLLSKREIKTVVPLFDNDQQGYKYTLRLDQCLKSSKGCNSNDFNNLDIDSLPPETLEKMAKEVPNAEFPMLKDWNEDLMIKNIKDNSFTQNVEFLDAVRQEDKIKLLRLKNEEYIPCNEIFNYLRDKGVSENTLSTVETLFADTKSIQKTNYSINNQELTI